MIGYVIGKIILPDLYIVVEEMVGCTCCPSDGLVITYLGQEGVDGRV